MNNSLVKKMISNYSSFCMNLFFDDFKEDEKDNGFIKRYYINKDIYPVLINVNPLNKKIYVTEKGINSKNISKSTYLLSDEMIKDYSKFKTHLMIIIGQYMI